MDTKSALICIVPAIDAMAIQNLRSKYDNAYTRWMPHFNIDCFPFFPPQKHRGLATKIQNICSKYHPIKINLMTLSNFKCEAKRLGTLYAKVEDATGSLFKLREEILKELNINVSGTFEPHVTLGRFNTQEELELVQKSIKWFPFHFELNGLDLIVREENTPFKRKYSFPFSGQNYIILEPKILSLEYISTVSNFGDYYIYKLKSLKSSEQINDTYRYITNFLLIDNSGSMGSATKEATNIIGKGMISLQTIPGEVIMFSEDVSIFKDIKSVSDIDKITFSRQGRTNITGAVKETIKRIVIHSKSSKVHCHYILTFLSDGGHNVGPELSEDDIINMRKLILENEIQLSIIVVGISSNDTKLGMKIKTELETVSINSLNSVYYANNHSEMNNVLNQLILGCKDSFRSGISANISVDGGILMENNNCAAKIFISNDNIIPVKSEDGDIPTLLINNQIIKTDKTDIDSNDVTMIIDYLLPKLSQIKIAYGSKNIDSQIKILENFIDTAESAITKMNSINSDSNIKIGTSKLSSHKRIEILKQIRKSQISFQEERNKLKSLQANIANDSAKQAEYLTGFNKKYASKAIIKSDLINVSLNDIINQIENIQNQLKLSLTDDKQKKNSMGLTEETSLLSLNTPTEQLEEWLTYDLTQFTDVYSLLVYFGFSCYPVKFVHNNAVQMDPFQTECIHIEPFMADTSTLMLSNQMGHKLTTPSGKQFNDGLILIKPSVEQSSLLLMKTFIYQYLCSTVLCRDLYMFHPRMTFSMHAHALKRAIVEFYNTKSKAYLELALKIVYSFKKIGEKDITLFNHWWKDWGTITQSDNDNCKHPVQLLLMFSCLQVDNITQYNIPLLNLLNEALARTFKIILSSNQNEDSIEIGIDLMLKLFGINETNSPNPNPDILFQEPPLANIRDSCQIWANIEDDSVLKNVFKTSSITDYVNKILIPYVQTFEFGLLLQKRTDWEKEFLKSSEDLLTYLNDNLMKISDIYDYLDPKMNKDQVATTMFLQAVLHHTSQTRCDINMKSVLDSVTLQDMIIDLRMIIYCKLSKVKKEKWLSIIGDVTYQNALNSDINVYTMMIGKHTHGHSKDVFWGMLKAAMYDNDKMSAFKNRSNGTIDRCIDRINKGK
jgi:2'-5' RNA ligase